MKHFSSLPWYSLVFRLIVIGSSKSYEIYANLSLLFDTSEKKRISIKFNNQNNYHLRRAVYYLNNALAVCSEDKIHPTDGGDRPHIDPLVVIIAYRAYNDN